MPQQTRLGIVIRNKNLAAFDVGTDTSDTPLRPRRWNGRFERASNAKWQVMHGEHVDYLGIGKGRGVPGAACRLDLRNTQIIKSGQKWELSIYIYKRDGSSFPVWIGQSSDSKVVGRYMRIQGDVKTPFLTIGV